MKTKLALGGITLVLGTSYGAAAFAQAKPDTLVKQRQAAMTLQMKYWGPLASMASGKASYNADTVARNAAYLDILTKMAWDGFADSTKDEKSRALPAVFTDKDKFKTAADGMQGAVSKLVKVSRSDEATVKAALADVGKTCDTCHDDFRAKR